MDMVDRISDLPEPILHHIMSFLPLQQVVRTIVLSKRWKQAWHTFPFFEFDGSFNSVSRNKMILRYLEQTLLNRRTDGISVKNFSLQVFLTEDTEFLRLIDQCLGYAIDSNVKTLKLRLLGGLYHSSFYYWPQIIFCSKSIDVLKLSGPTPVFPRINVMLSSLRMLCLVEVNADDHVIKNLVVGSHLIEHLQIIYCRGLTCLELTNLNKLKTVAVLDNDALERLKIKGRNVHEIDISAPSSCEISLAACENLKRLGLYNLSITDKWLCNEVSKFPLLESLSIDHCNKLEGIKVSSPCLKTLCIYGCSKLIAVKIETPNLRIFKYGGDLFSFYSNDLALSEADLNFDSDNIGTQWFVRYIELLGEFRQFSNTLTLHSNTGENVIVPRKLRQILFPPLSVVNRLNVKVHGLDCSVSESISVSEFIDDLLWIAPHVETISLELEDEYGYCNKASIKFSYKELFCEGASETPRYCQTLPVSCWQHCVKEVNFEGAMIYEGKTIKAKSISLQDEQFLEKIDWLCSD